VADAIGEDGQVKRARPTAVIGRCEGPGALTSRQADRAAWDQVLSKINQAEIISQSLMKVKDFIERRFQPEHVLALKSGGRDHYAVQLKHLVAELGEMSLREVKREHVQRMCLGLLQKTYTLGKDDEKWKKKARQVPYSVHAALHLKNATSAVFEHAKAHEMYTGENLACYLRLPEMKRKQKHSLTHDQMSVLLETLPSRAAKMSHIAVLTSLNVAEICGLQWKDINLTDNWVVVDGEPIDPMSIFVVRQWSTRKGGGAYDTLKEGSRRRKEPIDRELAAVVRVVVSNSKFTGLEDPVFASRTGRPVDAHNIFNRTLKPIGVKLGMPWLGWHVFRHTYTSWVRQEAASPADQMAMLGHSDIQMTIHYGQQDLDRRRLIVEQMSAKLTFKRKIDCRSGRKRSMTLSGPRNRTYSGQGIYPNS
jgi:integrase